MHSFQSRAPVARTCPQRYTSPTPRDVTQIAGFYAPTPTHSPLSKLNKTDVSRRWPPCRSGLAWTKRDGVLRITMLTVRSSPRRSLQPSLRLIDSPGTIYCACVLIFLWHPLLPYWYSYKHPVPDRVKPSFVIFWHPGTLTISPERQSARMSKIINDGLTRSCTGCFIAVPIYYGNSGCQSDYNHSIACWNSMYIFVKLVEICMNDCLPHDGHKFTVHSP